MSHGGFSKMTMKGHMLQNKSCCFQAVVLERMWTVLPGAKYESLAPEDFSPPQHGASQQLTAEKVLRVALP